MTAQQPIRVDVAAGQDARSRIDDGVERPGDRALADRYDAYCQQEWGRFQDACHEADRRARIADAVACHRPDCDGDGCDHWTHEEVP